MATHLKEIGKETGYRFTRFFVDNCQRHGETQSILAEKMLAEAQRPTVRDTRAFGRRVLLTAKNTLGTATTPY